MSGSASRTAPKPNHETNQQGCHDLTPETYPARCQSMRMRSIGLFMDNDYHASPIWSALSAMPVSPDNPEKFINSLRWG
jgi:hypothetical protein